MEHFFTPGQSVSVFPGERVAVLAPHADDEVLGCGGALANLVARGKAVQVVVVTDEGQDPVTGVRHGESQAAAACLGYPAPEFWGLTDGQVFQVSGLDERIHLWLEGWNADLLLVCSPWEMHRDHRAVAEAAVTAVCALGGRVRLAFYEIGQPLLPNLLLDITDFRDVKDRAMACFVSQLTRQDYDRHLRALNVYRTYTLPRSVLAAEAYCLLSVAELEALDLDQAPHTLSLALHRADLERHRADEALNAARANILLQERALSDLRMQQESLLTQCAALMGDLENMRRSTSWRITAPLRMFGYLRQGEWSLVAAGLNARWGGRLSLPLRCFSALRNRARRLLLGVASGNASANDQAHQALVTRRVDMTRTPLSRDPLHAGGEPDAWPCVDLAVVTHNSQRWIEGFVQSLLALDYPGECLMLYFVDHESSDGTVACLEAALPVLREAGMQAHLSLRPNRGFGAGQNAALQGGTSPFCLVTNVDLSFAVDALKQVVGRALRDDRETAAWELRQTPYEHPKFYDPVTGLTNWNAHACVLLRRSAFEAVGGYDEHLFMYGEDVELSWRLRRAGYVLRYCPSAVVWHDTYAAPGEVKPLQYSGSMVANHYLRFKYGHWRDMVALLGMMSLVTAPPGMPAGVLRHVGWRTLRLMPAALLGRRRGTAHFPLRGYDYDLARPGPFVRATFPPPSCSDGALPLVSIITRTTGGRPSLLRQALLSIAHQTYPAIEGIVVEDGGNSQASVVHNVGEVTGRTWRFLARPKGGRSAAGNAGLAAATGQWCLFLDDDDLLFADHVELLVETLKQHPGCVAAYSPAWEVATTWKEDESYQEAEPQLPAALMQPFDRELLAHHNYMAIQSVLFERALFTEHGGFDEDLDALEDWLLWQRYASRGGFAFVPKVTSLFRTPTDPAQRERRQRALDAAYPVVRERAFGGLRWRIAPLPETRSQEMEGLFHKVFGYPVSSGLRAWKYADGHGRVMAAWNRAGEMVAHYGGLVRPVWFFGEAVDACQMADVMVDPAERGVLVKKGVFYQVARAFYESQTPRQRLASYGFPNERAYRVGQRMGLYASAGRVYERHWPVLEGEVCCGDLWSQDDWRDKVQQQWACMALESTHLVLVRRDADYLAYRYRQRPDGHYGAYWVDEAGEGLIVVVRQRDDGLDWMDYVGALSRFGVALAALRKLAAALGVAVVRAWLTEPMLEASGAGAMRTVETDVEIAQWDCGGLQNGAVVTQGRWWAMYGDTDFM